MRSNGTRNFYDLFDALSIIILLGLSTLKYPLRLVDAAYAKYSFPYLQPLLKSWHMMDPDTQFSIDDLAQHKARDDLWIAVHGKVYAVSSYLMDHPGGDMILVGAGGGDATAAFEDVGHSDDAREALENMCIGKLPPSEQPRARVHFTSEPAPFSAASASAIASSSWSNFELLKASNWPAILPIISWFALYNTSYSIPVSSFWKGFSFFCMTSTSIALILVENLKGALVMHKDITEYPAYLSSSSPAICGSIQKLSTGVLNPRKYQSLTLVDRRKQSHNTYRLTVALPQPHDRLGLPVGQHVNIQAEIENKLVSRSYTPTSSNKDLGRMDLTVKVYPDGKMGNYLASLPLGNSVMVRGPSGSFQKYHRYLCDHLYCIAGGSGITPMYQFIRAVCEETRDNTKVTLLYANRAVEDILFQKELDMYSRKHADQFNYVNVLSRPPADWAAETGRISQDTIKKYMPPEREQSKYLICGPDGMVSSMKEILVELGCEAPSLVSRSSDQVFIF